MKNLVLSCLIFSSIHVFAQEKKPVKMEVPTIALGENQNFDVLNYEAIASNEFSIMYLQELPATVISDLEFYNPAYIGAFAEKKDENDYRGFVNNSNRVLVLVRQTFGETGAAATKFWVVAVRELQSNTAYTMHYPASFIHPIIADHIPVTYSLKNVDQIPDLTEREFAALVAVGKQKYGFYEYPAVSYKSTYSTLADDLKAMKSGFKELKAVLGGGKMSLPKGENLLFKREVIDNIRLAATKVSDKESVELKIYISQSSDSEYELLASKTYDGKTNPMFASALVYDNDVKVSGAYGWTVLKPNDKDASSSIVIMGIDENGEPNFWEINSGKNGLNSFTPTFSYTGKEGIYVVSLNRDKIFKPFYQHHLLKPDGTAETLFPTTEEEVGSEKSEYLKTEQKAAAPSTGYQPTSTTGVTKVDVPVGIFERNNHRYLFETSKSTTTVGDMKNTQFTDLTVVHIDENNKIVEHYDITENKSSDMPYPMFLGDYSDKAYFLVNYPNMFKLVISDAKVETETVENDTYKLINQANGEYITFNQYGVMYITKSVIGNKTTLEFFPQN
ncbi:MAG: hypothetical protein NWS74_05575 [Salibacteraceae bacterium]|nr:hypothetical protein [Salibacteraceae bacterium]